MKPQLRGALRQLALRRWAAACCRDHAGSGVLTRVPASPRSAGMADSPARHSQLGLASSDSLPRRSLSGATASADTFRVHLPPLTASWVVEHGGLDQSQLVHKNNELFAAEERAGLPLFLTPQAARELQNGAVMARLLNTLFRKHAADCPISPDALAPGTEAVVVLRNWKEILLPVMRATFAIELSADKLALLVGGDSEVLTLLLETLCKRATGVRVAEDDESPHLLQKIAKRFDADVMDNIYLAANLVTGLYAAVMASMLGIFVPQACPPTDLVAEWHVCSVSENLKPQSQLNAGVLAFNYMTLALVLAGQAFFGYREWWIIESFDFDPVLPNDNLSQEVHLYPSFEKKMKRINLHAFRFSLLIMLFVGINFLMSCVHVLRDFSEGKSSATAIVSYSMLLLPRVLGWLINAHKAHTEDQPLSFFIKISALPNTIDADWRYRPEVYAPRYASAPAHGLAPAEEESIELLTSSR